jgi:hypothetical protein
MELRVWRELLRLVGSRILTLSVLALTCASWAFSTAEAAPAKSIKVDVKTGAIDPAGAVPFDQWITATSSAPIVLAEGEGFAQEADLEHCGGSQKGCTGGNAGSACGGKRPIKATCSLPVITAPAADGKGVTVRVDIPPLEYNSAYRLKLKLRGKKEIPLTADSLQRIEMSFAARINEIARAKDSRTAPDICRSLVDAIESEFKDKNVQIEAPLKSCAEGATPNDQIQAMEQRIEFAINSRNELLEAQQNLDDDRDAAVESNVRDAKAQDLRASQALRGSVREIVINNTWMPIPLGTAADANTTEARHISADAGLVYGWDLDETLTYVGANIYGRPINTDVSLASLKAEGLLTWRHRLSLTLGATVESINKDGQRKGIIGSSALVVGIGCRLTDVIRLSVGALVFKEENPNPLVTDDASLAVSPYVAISFDLDVAKQFGKMFPNLP